MGTDRLALTQLELRDGLAGLGDGRLLTGDRGEVAHGAVDELGVAGGVARPMLTTILTRPGTCMTFS
ncbi:hypothetical protein SHIRM173S_02121 [Streptomyces hirsutus]